jgi:hypothetical protein
MMISEAVDIEAWSECDGAIAMLPGGFDGNRNAQRGEIMTIQPVDEASGKSQISTGVNN